MSAAAQQAGAPLPRRQLTLVLVLDSNSLRKAAPQQDAESTSAPQSRSELSTPSQRQGSLRPRARLKPGSAFDSESLSAPKPCSELSTASQWQGSSRSGARQSTSAQAARSPLSPEPQPRGPKTNPVSFFELEPPRI